MLKKVLLKIYFYIKFPHQLADHLKIFFRTKKAKSLNIKFVKPNYIYLDRLNDRSIIIDVGCGYLADLSTFLINEYGMMAYGIDPTHKHRKSLKKIENETCGKFKHLDFAISSEVGIVTFFETYENESGSILKDHVNILNDNIKSYEVKTKNLKYLISSMKLNYVDYIKLDLEGAEYKLLEKTELPELIIFDQIFVEFHHRAIKKYTYRDTKRIVKLICMKGFQYFTLDDQNFLFYKQ